MSKQLLILRLAKTMPMSHAAKVAGVSKQYASKVLKAAGQAPLRGRGRPAKEGGRGRSGNTRVLPLDLDSDLRAVLQELLRPQMDAIDAMDVYAELTNRQGGMMGTVVA